MNIATPFDRERDVAPIPFDPGLLGRALAMKETGLPRRPQTGCFVWDPDGHIEAPYPTFLSFL